MKTEQHPYFPSGIWDGFYLYASGPQSQRHEMYFYLDFTDGRLTGSGSDHVGGFTWDGTYDVTTFKVRGIKHYGSHDVIYEGMADESGIYGRWSIPPFSSGGFHIWPRKGGDKAEEAEVKVKKKVKVRVKGKKKAKKKVLTGVGS